jgi:hypothetical protein
MKVLHFFLFAAVSALAGFLFVSCDVFLNKPSGDVTGRIDQAVHDANAPYINVRIDAGGNGVAVPSGNLTSTVKLEVPFTVNFSAYSFFGFLEWRAYLNDKRLDSKEVVFSDPTNRETTITINVNPGADSVELVPYGEELAYVHNWQYTTPVVTNQLIQIQFSKPMDRNAFIFSDPEGERFYHGEYIDDWDVDGDGYYDWIWDYDKEVNQDVDWDIDLVTFNNIRILGTVVAPSNGAKLLSTVQHLENFYYPPKWSLDGTLLYLWAREDENGEPLLKSFMEEVTIDNAKTPYTFLVEIVVDGQVKDASGIPLGAKKSLSYKFLTVDHSDNETKSRLPSAIYVAWGAKAKPGDYDFEEKDFDLEDFTFTRPEEGNWVYLVFMADAVNAPVTGAFVFERPVDSWEVNTEDGGFDYENDNGLNNWWTYPGTGTDPEGWLTGSKLDILDEDDPAYRGILNAILKDEETMEYFDFPSYAHLNVVRYQLDPEIEFEDDDDGKRAIQLMIAPITMQDKVDLPGYRYCWGTGDSNPEPLMNLKSPDGFSWVRIGYNNIYYQYGDGDY